VARSAGGVLDDARVFSPLRHAAQDTSPSGEDAVGAASPLFAVALPAE